MEMINIIIHSRNIRGKHTHTHTHIQRYEIHTWVQCLHNSMSKDGFTATKQPKRTVHTDTEAMVKFRKGGELKKNKRFFYRKVVCEVVHLMGALIHMLMGECHGILSPN